MTTYTWLTPRSAGLSYTAVTVSKGVPMANQADTFGQSVVECAKVGAASRRAVRILKTAEVVHGRKPTYKAALVALEVGLLLEGVAGHCPTAEGEVL